MRTLLTIVFSMAAIFLSVGSVIVDRVALKNYEQGFNDGIAQQKTADEVKVNTVLFSAGPSMGMYVYEDTGPGKPTKKVKLDVYSKCMWVKNYAPSGKTFWSDINYGYCTTLIPEYWTLKKDETMLGYLTHDAVERLQKSATERAIQENKLFREPASKMPSSTFTPKLKSPNPLEYNPDIKPYTDSHWRTEDAF